MAALELVQAMEAQATSRIPDPLEVPVLPLWPEVGRILTSAAAPSTRQPPAERSRPSPSDPGKLCPLRRCAACFRLTTGAHEQARTWPTWRRGRRSHLPGANQARKR